MKSAGEKSRGEETGAQLSRVMRCVWAFTLTCAALLSSFGISESELGVLTGGSHHCFISSGMRFDFLLLD